MVLLVPVLECLKQTCLFMVCRLCPFSQLLGSIPLKCVYLCSLTYIISILETNSDHLFFCSLLMASESHNGHLLSVFSRFINRWWGNRWVITTLDREMLPEAVVLLAAGTVNQTLLALCLCPVINPWCPHSFSQVLFLTEFLWGFFLHLHYLDEAGNLNCCCGWQKIDADDLYLLIK